MSTNIVSNCIGVKKNGDRCWYKKKFGEYCGIHFKQNQSVVVVEEKKSDKRVEKSDRELRAIKREQIKDLQKPKKVKIKKVKTYRFPKPDECPVCLDEFCRTDEPLMPCAHWIHRECIMKSGKRICPLCRGQIILTHDENKIFREAEQAQREQRNQDHRNSLNRMLLFSQFSAQVLARIHSQIFIAPSLRN